MNRDGMRRVLELCERALARPAAEREGYLDQACAGDAELRAAVNALLAEQAGLGSFLDRPAWAAEPPCLAAGSRLGPYEIVAPIGAGGMGEVYKARDTRLDRTVAIKVLAPEISDDPARRARFEVEAKTIAGLSHAHICALYDVGTHDGSLFLVMEHLDGETLAARLRRGPLPLPQALAIAAEIAEALSAAHRQGVIHRDLKPGNVMLTKSGGVRQGSPQAKLLDFGLAKLKRAAVAASTMTRAAGTGEPQTEAGTVLGTVPYMAPEQLEGRQADARSDIFSFGAVLYEMLAGKRAFQGDSHASVAAAILEHEPAAVSSLQPRVPPMLDRLVRQCLAKAPDDRPDSAHDVANNLRWIRETNDAVTAVTTRRRWSARRVSWLAASLLGASIVGAGLMAALRPVPSRPVVQTELPVAPADALDGGVIRGGVTVLTPAGSRTAFTWSPDGRLVFAGVREGVRRLYVRRLEDAVAQVLPNTEGAQAPAVSPDGQWVAFWVPDDAEAGRPPGTRDGSIKKVPLAGGQAVSLLRTAPPFGFAWQADGRLLFGSGGSRGSGGRIQEVPSDASVKRVSPPDGHNRHDLPCLLPGGRTVLYTGKKRIHSTGSDEAILAQDLGSGTTKALPIRDATDVRYVASGGSRGHLLFLRRGVLFAVAFDAERVEVLGDQVPVLEGTVAQALTDYHADDRTGAGQFAVSPAGTLAWVPGPVGRHMLRSLVTVDRLGRVTARLRPPDRYQYGVSLSSPEGPQLSAALVGATGVSLAICNLGPGAPALLNTEGESMWPVWSPDGKRIAFLWLNDGRYSVATIAADEQAPPRVLVNGVFLPASFTPDGRRLLAVRWPDGIVSISTDTPAAVESVLDTSFVELSPVLSRDGRWLAYESNETGRFEVYVRAFPGSGRAESVSGEGGSSPVWRADGRELFFVAPAGEKSRMMVVDFAPGSPPRVGLPRVLFEFDPRDLNFSCAMMRCYEVAPDGQQFYVWQNQVPPLPPVTHVNLIQNWFEKLKAQAPPRR